eukprot:5490674-Prorocentrum_lima.AAC.1
MCIRDRHSNAPRASGHIQTLAVRTDSKPKQSLYLHQQHTGQQALHSAEHAQDPRQLTIRPICTASPAC